MKHSFIRPLPCVAFALVLINGAVHAQGFEDGSFETAAPAEQPTPAATGGDLGNGFDQGSFEPGAASAEEQLPAQPVPPVDAQPAATPKRRSRRAAMISMAGRSAKSPPRR